MTDLKSVLIEEESSSPFIDPNEVAIEANRYLFYAGDDIEPRRKRQVKKLRFGGMELELDYKCFTTTKGHIWRNMITPMTSGHYLTDEQLLPEGATATAVTTVGSFGHTRTDYATRIHPGEEIRTLLFGKSDLPVKGVVEIKALRNWDWKAVKDAGIQRFFFPEWDAYKTGLEKMPVQLSWTRAQIQKAIASTSDDTLISIGEDMLLSAENFYAWGIDKLKVETTLVKTPPSPGASHVYTYSGMAEQLFEILEQQREDFLRQDFTALAGNVQFSNTDTQKEFAEMMKKQDENQALIIELLAKQMGKDMPITATVKPVHTLCPATKKNGEPCGAPPIKGETYCTFHRDKESHPDQP